MERNKMFVWFNKNDNLKSRFRTSKNATCIEKPKCSHLISKGEKRSVAFVTGHLFTFLVVLSLICLVTTQILICENQTA